MREALVVVPQIDRGGHLPTHCPDDQEEDCREEDPHERQENDHVGLGHPEKPEDARAQRADHREGGESHEGGVDLPGGAVVERHEPERCVPRREDDPRADRREAHEDHRAERGQEHVAGGHVRRIPREEHGQGAKTEQRHAQHA